MLEIYTSKSVTAGHPDKLADQISDALVDKTLSENPNGAAVIDTFLCGNNIVLTGVIAGGLTCDPYPLVNEIIAEAGYTGPTCEVDYRNIDIISRICSREKDAFKYSEPSPGGTVYGYASNETPELMPLPTVYAHRLARLMSEMRETMDIPYLRPECTVQVSALYRDNKPERIRSVFISVQHYDGIPQDELAGEVQDRILSAIPQTLVDNQTDIIVRTYGESDTGPSFGKVGFTGRKLDVDSYGAFTSNASAAFSGRTPRFGDRTIACMARYIAKNIVAAGLAERCEVALPYIQGSDEPLHLAVNTFRGNMRSDAKLSKIVASHFDLRPEAIIRTLKLNQPIYQKLAVYGCFGRTDLDVRWESTDIAETLRLEKQPFIISNRSFSQSMR